MVKKSKSGGTECSCCGKEIKGKIYQPIIHITCGGEKVAHGLIGDEVFSFCETCATDDSKVSLELEGI